MSRDKNFAKVTLQLPRGGGRSTGVDRLNKNAPVSTADLTAREAPDPGGFAVASWSFGFPWGCGQAAGPRLQGREGHATKSRPLQGDRTGRHQLHKVAIDVPSVPFPSPGEHRVKNTRPLTVGKGKCCHFRFIGCQRQWVWETV